VPEETGTEEERESTRGEVSVALGHFFLKKGSSGVSTLKWEASLFVCL
jgi:hypothetical protein